jgi:DNA polymerase I-like protein with 3'-5' exonuclease and polymerase domains
LYGLIFTPEELREEVDYFLQQDSFVFDVESMDGSVEGTRGIPTQNRVVWISLSTYGRTIVVPMGHPSGSIMLHREYRKKNKETGKFENFPAVFSDPPKQMRPSEVFEILRPLFFHPTIIKGAHNTPFDIISIYKYYGELPSAPYACTLTAQWVLDENIGQPGSGGPRRPRAKGLKDLVEWYYGVKYDKENVGKCIEKHTFDKVARYVYLDSKYDWTLWLRFRQQIQEQDLTAIWQLESNVTVVCCAMGIVGAPVDVEALTELDEFLTIRLEEIEAKIYKAAGKVFNIRSNPQKVEILFGKKSDGGQGLKPLKLSKKTQEPSTDKESLELHEGNAVVDALLEYAEVDKLRGTYVRAYLGDPDDPDKPCLIFGGRIHTDLVQYGTVTGRFSSRSPNLQNIPAPRTELGKKVRGLFKAPPGYKLLVADYGQMELRILASMIGFGGLYDGFHAGIDAHTQTAALVFGVAVEAVEKWQRDAAKTLNFAIVYGAQNKKVAATLGISVEEADELLLNHRKAFPEIYKFKDKIFKLAQSRTEEPYIRTILGRKRRVWEAIPKIAHVEARKLPWWEDYNHHKCVNYVLARAERQVVNSLVQGSLGDIIKLAMVRMHDVLSKDAKSNPDNQIHMILSVHDELVILCPEDRVEEGSSMLLEAMIGAEIQKLIKVPLDVGEIKVVDRWAEAK